MAIFRILMVLVSALAFPVASQESTPVNGGLVDTDGDGVPDLYDSDPLTPATGDCASHGGRVSLVNRLYGFGETDACEGYVSLTSGPDVTIQDGGDVTYRAPTVVLFSGFAVDQGGTFTVARGGDPGVGVWSPADNPDLIVFDLSPTSNRTFVPGCIHGQDWVTTGCENLGSVEFGQVYAARVHFGTNMTLELSIDRAEAGEQFSTFFGAVSALVGDLNPADPNCRIEPIVGFVTLVDEAYVQANTNPEWLEIGFDPFANACKVPSDTTLYLNITPDPNDLQASRCGLRFLCRTQILD